jgi:hypothetical protein
MWRCWRTGIKHSFPGFGKHLDHFDPLRLVSNGATPLDAVMYTVDGAILGQPLHGVPLRQYGLC